ncbi:MAG: helix-turn-helix domain-containing protein [Candidatus Lindowbacteria bacterium]|nr:helix-turn-helix domain-containing protein [Candidatus Lindowbacteria bacterium]
MRHALPFSLCISFAEIAGVPIRFCGPDGQLFAGAPTPALAGPCEVLRKGGALDDKCAKSHAEAIVVATELRPPYVFNCHMRLAGWAIPILQNDNFLPAAILCGGMLFLEPDAALARYAERVATTYGVDAATLAGSLDSVRVVPRERGRAAADFLFRMIAAFMSDERSAETPEHTAPEPNISVLPPPLVFPPVRRKETKKAKSARAEECEQRTAEAEIIRLLRDRRSDEALRRLIAQVSSENDSSAARSFVANLNLAETFARLFGILARSGEVPTNLRHKQANLIENVLLRKGCTDPQTCVERACRNFITIAESAAGAPRPKKVKMIQRFVESNLSRKLTLGMVGAKLGLKDKALNALVRKHYGMSFNDYVTSLRVTEARRLLQSPDLTLGQIAERTGFSDQSYFTKVFKASVGLTPTEFRNKGI